MSSLSRCVFCLSLLVGVACASPAKDAGAGKQEAQNASTPSALPVDVPDLPESSGPRPVYIGQFRPGTFGPRLLVQERKGHVVWADLSGEKRGYFALPVTPAGLKDAPVRFSDVPRELSLLELGSLPSSQTLVLSASPGTAGDGEVLRGHVVSEHGELLSGPHVLSTGEGRVLWVRSFPSRRGACVVFARQRGSAAELQAVLVGSQGLLSESSQLSQTARAWQLATGPAGAFLATIEQGDAGREVLVRRLTESGEVKGSPTRVATTVRGGFDLDLAVLGQRLVVAYSESASPTSRLLSAVVDQAGVVVSPAAPMTPPRGAQSLVRLLATQDAVMAVWEEPRHQRAAVRELLVSRLDAEARAPFADYRLAAEGEGPLLPLLAASGRDVVAVTLAPSCQGSSDCDTIGAYFMRFGAREGVDRGGELWLKASTEVRPQMSWDLVCDASRCQVLLASAEDAPEVVLAELKDDWGSATQALAKHAAGERLLRDDALGDIRPLADLAAVRTSEGTLVSWVTFFDPGTPYEVPKAPAPDGRMAPVRALLHTQFVRQAEGHAAPEVSDQVISYRARSLGGVALTQPNGGQSLVAWVALDGAEPQVFGTLVDGRGRRIRQKMLTRSHGELTDVCAVAVGDGYFVAWVAVRDGQAQVRGVRLGHMLQPLAPEGVLVDDARSPTDLALLAVEGGLRLTYGEGGTLDSQADLRSVMLDPVTFRPSGVVVELEASPLHSHSPLYLGRADEASPAVLGSVEEQTDPDRGVRAWLRLVPLDALGLPTSSGVRVQFAGLVRGFSGDCDAAGCRLAVSVASPAGGELWGVVAGPDVLQGRVPAQPFFLSRQEGHTLQAAPPAVLRREIFVENEGPAGAWELTRILVDW